MHAIHSVRSVNVVAQKTRGNVEKLTSIQGWCDKMSDSPVLCIYAFMHAAPALLNLQLCYSPAQFSNSSRTYRCIPYLLCRYDTGCTGITNIDFSQGVIKEMMLKNLRKRPLMKWQVMDMTQTKASTKPSSLPYSACSFLKVFCSYNEDRWHLCQADTHLTSLCSGMECMKAAPW